VCSRPYPALQQLWPGQLGFVHVNHTIDERNRKIAIETCDNCKRRKQRHSWLKDKCANLSLWFWVKGPKHTLWEICQNYQAGEVQPLRTSQYFRSVLMKSGSRSGSPNRYVSSDRSFSQLRLWRLNEFGHALTKAALSSTILNTSDQSY
jgi:hypothetical protein